MQVDQWFAGCRHGALTVIEASVQPEEITRRLRLLNEHLFLERQIPVGEIAPVWCVVEDQGNRGYVTHYEFREPDGTPIPYPSDRIVAEMQRRYARGPLSGAEIDKRNDALREKFRLEARAEREALVEDHHRMAKDTFSAAFHRGVGLRMARDRMRAKGFKV